MQNRTVYIIIANNSDLLNPCIYADFKYPKISQFQYDFVDEPLTLYKCTFLDMDDYYIKNLDSSLFNRDSDWILANCDDDQELITF